MAGKTVFIDTPGLEGEDWAKRTDDTDETRRAYAKAHPLKPPAKAKPKRLVKRPRKPQRSDIIVAASEARDFIQGPDGKMAGSTGSGGKSGGGKGKGGGRPGTGQMSFGGHVTPAASSTYLGLGIGDTENLADTVESDPERFQFQGEPGGISAGGEYIDQETGAHFFIKGSDYYPNEAAHELEANALLQDTGLMHMDVVPAGYISVWDEPVEAVAMTHADTDPDVREVLGEGVRQPTDEESMRAMAEDAVRLQTFDQVVNNTDRHAGNYLTVVDQDGHSRLYAIDNSLIDPTGDYLNEEEPRGERYFPYSARDFDATISSERIAEVRNDFLDKMTANLGAADRFAPVGEVEAIRERIDTLRSGGVLMPPEPAEF